jgi:hypothetical protein
VTGATVAAGIAVTGASASVARSAESDQWGDLIGRFVYDGTAPEREKLKVEKELECCGKFDIRDESLMVGDDGGLANVYIYVRSKGVTICPELEKAAPEKVVLDNRDCIFVPHCMKIWYPKQTFEIINSDPVGQNVAFSPVADTPANLVLAVDGKATHKFGRAQRVPVPIKCNYHPWESAYILPGENPYAAISATDGTFRIAKLPVGTLEFQVWHERPGYLATSNWAKGRFEMEIKAGENDLGTISLPPELLVKKT